MESAVDVVVERDEALGLVLVRLAASGLTEWRFAEEMPASARAVASPRGEEAAPRRAAARGDTRRAAAGPKGEEAAPRAAADEQAARAELLVRNAHQQWLQSGMPSSWLYWADDGVMAAIGRALTARNYVMLDDFIARDVAAGVAREVAAAHDAGRLAPGNLAGGRSGANLTYAHSGVRGDVIGWVEPGAEPGWAQLEVYTRRLKGLVALLREEVCPEALRGVGKFSRVMAACYPGHGACYMRHCDNACDAGEGDRCNGRRLTAVLYLNAGWKPAHGGQLRIYPPGDADGSEPLAEVAPLSGRLVLFFADRRCPHEVLPAFKKRLAVTVWFMHDDEYARSQAGGRAAEGMRGGDGAESERARVDAEERASIEKEMAKFEQALGGKATIVKGGDGGGGGDAAGTAGERRR